MAKLVVYRKDGTKVWINPYQIVKMEQLPSGDYFVILTNGECFPVDYQSARRIENFFEERLD